MALGFIGFGEVGFEIGNGLVNEGFTEIYAFDPMQNSEKFGKLVKERAQSAKITLLKSAEEVADKCEFILSVVPGAFAIDAAKSVLEKIKRGKVFADLSTSLPSAKKEIDKLITEKGGKFVDGALMASLSQTHHKVPILLAGSGSDQLINALKPFGMVIKKISETAGDAISVKMVRSIYMKGIAALGAEMLEAANILRVDRLVLDSISDTLNATPFEKTNNYLVVASAWHGARQVHEMEDVTKMLRDIGVAPIMTEATTKRLEWFRDLEAHEYFGLERPEEWKAISTLWDKKNPKLK
ncbi:NAD(P)-dependent oxidoreductase [bacterium BFN5]|nr:NAD(P)-dependent oxidoreductase [bacterium BFN5]QJW45515.1 NAD(P)-dependent oxidoreductase [bacterium BFN5]